MIDEIYAAAAGQWDWQDVLVRLSDLCGVENAAMVVVDPETAFSSVLTPRADPEVVRAYEQDGWWMRDPTVPATSGAPVGKITSLKDTGREAFLSSTFHNEFWATSGLGAERLASNLLRQGAGFASIVLQAGQRTDEIDDEAAARFAVVLPHLVRAVEIEQRMRRLSMQTLLLGVGAGRPDAVTLAVDIRARPITDLGQPLDEAHLPRGMRLHAGRLVLPTTALTGQLDQLIAGCAALGPAARPRGGEISFDPDGRGQVVVEALPCPDPTQTAALLRPVAALLVVTDHGARQEALKRRMQEEFRLTPAESTLCLEILRGDGRDAAAARLGISVSTARTHLSRIFEKTGTNRQAELVRLFAAERD
ncbi:helix-turn-helix transcriptional regulator [Pseudooceanicola nanhaiensis]|uniref:helix-turn-helix transcriptional regulator n=1 Tax=Pseudooceanicola nanhaiensis TaxID=375761 RepID=UPI001CD1DD4F|nr:helix-turn-helix transcriptional regulator [Pseudooceanicola nanhaiensis]MCA0922049.1 helix-turn-helix transcriptional regulator [Pseudooceanicola nanhaiensis]